MVLIDPPQSGRKQGHLERGQPDWGQCKSHAATEYLDLIFGALPKLSTRYYHLHKPTRPEPGVP
jgi:hypothetical protein